MRKETQFTDQIFQKFVGTAHVDGAPPMSTPCSGPFVYKNTIIIMFIGSPNGQNEFS